MIYKTPIKRCADLLLAFFMIMILLPIFLILIIVLVLHHNGNPFFYQPRPGLRGEIFQILKFKTMTDDVDKNGDLLSDHDRITGIGKLIRSSSLDEIPQLINVIRGDMSFVGPRPLLAEYLVLYSPIQSRRHDVRPGITGWAQINGRNAITWEKKLNLDVWYVENHSFWLDSKILFQTLLNVLQGKGVTQHGHVSMDKFKGSAECVIVKRFISSQNMN